MKIAGPRIFLLILVFLGFLAILKGFNFILSIDETQQDFLIEKIKYPNDPECKALLNVSQKLA